MKLLFIFVLGCVAYVNAVPVNNAVSKDDKVYSAEMAKIKEEISNSRIPTIEEENTYEDSSTKLIEEGSGGAKENNLLSQETEEEMDNKKEESIIPKKKESDPFDVPFDAAITKLMEEESSGPKENNPLIPNKKERLKNERFRQKLNAFIKKTSPPT